MSYLDDATSLGVSPLGAGVGWAEPFGVPNPNPGVLVVPRVLQGDFWERVLAARATFTADATAGTRNPRFQILDGSQRVLYEATLSTGVALSTSVTASVGTAANMFLAASGFTQAAIPDLLLAPGYTAQFVVNSVGAADAWSGVVFYMGRYPSSAIRTGPAG